jgi:hypothetical protein
MHIPFVANIVTAYFTELFSVILCSLLSLSDFHPHKKLIPCFCLLLLLLLRAACSAFFLYCWNCGYESGETFSLSKRQEKRKQEKYLDTLQRKKNVLSILGSFCPYLTLWLLFYFSLNVGVSSVYTTNFFFPQNGIFCL